MERGKWESQLPNGQINLTLTNAKKLGDRIKKLPYPLASVYSSDIVGVLIGNDSHNEWRKKQCRQQY
jgi:hypothetical protein